MKERRKETKQDKYKEIRKEMMKPRELKMKKLRLNNEETNFVTNEKTKTEMKKEILKWRNKIKWQTRTGKNEKSKKLEMQKPESKWSGIKMKKPKQIETKERQKCWNQHHSKCRKQDKYEELNIVRTPWTKTQMKKPRLIEMKIPW